MHLIRHSLKYVPGRQYNQVVKDLKPVYAATDVDAAQEALERFDQKWSQQLPPVVNAWRDSWEYVIPFLAFPPDVRRVIYTTNPIEALNRQLRKRSRPKDIPQRGGRQKTDLPMPHERHPQVDQDRRLDESPPGVQDPLRRPSTRLTPTQLDGHLPQLWNVVRGEIGVRPRLLIPSEDERVAG